MFSGIFTAGQQIEGPKSSNLIAEPAQVMVLVPGARAQKAESSLATLKSYIIGFGFIFILVFVLFGAYMLFKRRTKYEARSLPGPIAEKKNVLPNVVMPENEQTNIQATTSSLKQATLKRQDEDDIIIISGKLPIWSITEDTVQPEEPKVSENSNSINTLIKSREQLTKHFESLMSNKIISN